MKDSDLNFARHLRNLTPTVGCSAVMQNHCAEPYQVSVHSKVYEAEFTKAVQTGCLPNQAQAVQEEMVAKLQFTIRAWNIQQQSGVEDKLGALEMGRQPHAAFVTE